MSDNRLSSIDLSPDSGGPCDVLFVAGEHSGDEQAARMLKAALAENPSLRACAFGGKALESAGAKLLFDMTAYSVVGLFEVLKNYSFFAELSDRVVRWIKNNKPRAVCFVDYPGFNLRIADRLRREGVSLKGGGNIKVLYYISPQIWAWKSRRRFKIAECVDALGVIFPFEPKCYSDTGLKADFVGHPFLEDSYRPPVVRDDNGAILLLAGSREIAVSRIFPVMIGALRKLPNEKAVAIYPNEAIKKILQGVLDKNPDVAPRVSLTHNDDGNVKAKAVMMSSGTMSLTCSLEGIPGAIVYKANPVTYAIGRALVKILYLSIANILLQKPAWREFIQFDAKPAKLAAYMRECLDNQNVRAEFLNYAAQLKKILHSPPKMSAAEWLIENVES